MYVYVYVCVYVFVFVCMCVCMYVHIYINVHSRLLLSCLEVITAVTRQCCTQCSLVNKLYDHKLMKITGSSVTTTGSGFDAR